MPPRKEKPKYDKVDFVKKATSLEAVTDFTAPKRREVHFTTYLDDGTEVEFKGEDEFSDSSELLPYLNSFANIATKPNGESNPLYDAESGWIKDSEVYDILKSVLHDRGYAPATIFRALDVHIKPAVEDITQTLRQIKESENVIKKNNRSLSSSPFAVLKSDQNQAEEDKKQILKDYIEERKAKLKQKKGVFINLIKNILEKPERFGLVSNETLESTENTTLSVDELKERLFGDNALPYSEVFIINGKRIKLEDQKKLCREAIASHPDIKGKGGDENKSIDLIFNDVIKPVIDRSYEVLKSDSPQDEKNKELDMLSGETAELMAFLLSEHKDEKDVGSIALIASLIWNGKLPEGYDLDDLPVSFPLLEEREPPSLKKELQKLEGQERFEKRFNFNLDKIKEISEEELGKITETVIRGDKKDALSIFSTRVGLMPQYRRLALCRVLLERTFGTEGENVFSESDFYDFHASVTNDLFSQERDVINEIESLDKKEEDYEIKLRSFKRRQDKLIEELFEKLGQYLNPETNFMQKMISAGSSGGVLLLTFEGNN